MALAQYEYSALFVWLQSVKKNILITSTCASTYNCKSFFFLNLLALKISGEINPLRPRISIKWNISENFLTSAAINVFYLYINWHDFY